MKQKNILFRHTRPNWGIGILIIAFILAAYFIQEFKKKKTIDSCSRYTIAYVTSIGRRNINFSYTINNRNLSGSWIVNPRNINEFFNFKLYPKDFLNKRLLLRVNCEKPEIYEIDWRFSIPYSINNFPEDGWKNIPENFSKTRFF